MNMNIQKQIIRRTAQRQIILEELAKTKTHPTANDLYDLVRKRLPRIGLGTVYRNLEIMANTGLIRKLEIGGTQKRFDFITKPHCHIRCTCCDKVEDVELDMNDDMVKAAAKVSPFQVTGYSIEFSGLCDDCLPEQNVTNNTRQSLCGF